MLEEIMAFCGVEAKDTLMIGDTGFDLQMAQNAGADSLGISHGAHDINTLLAHKPKTIVDDLYQVQSFIDNTQP